MAAGRIFRMFCWTQVLNVVTVSSPCRVFPMLFPDETRVSSGPDLSVLCKSPFITLYQKIAGLTRKIGSFTNTKNVADKSGASPSRLFTSGAERGFESTFSCLSNVG